MKQQTELISSWQKHRLQVQPPPLLLALARLCCQIVDILLHLCFMYLETNRPFQLLRTIISTNVTSCYKHPRGVLLCLVLFSQWRARTVTQWPAWDLAILLPARHLPSAVTLTRNNAPVRNAKAVFYREESCLIPKPLHCLLLSKCKGNGANKKRGHLLPLCCARSGGGVQRTIISLRSVYEEKLQTFGCLAAPSAHWEDKREVAFRQNKPFSPRTLKLNDGIWYIIKWCDLWK